MHGEESQGVEPVLDLHAITQFRAGALLVLAHDRALSIADTAVQFGNGGVLHLALIVLRVVLRVSLFLRVVLVLVSVIVALMVRNVIITLDQTLALALTSPQVPVLSLLAVSQHHHVTLELPIFLNRLQKLSKRDRKSTVNDSFWQLQLF